MAKQRLANIRLSKSALTDDVYIGKVAKDKVSWLYKKNITNDFLKAVVDRWAGCEQTITSSNGKKYEITVKEITGKTGLELIKEEQ